MIVKTADSTPEGIVIDAGTVAADVLELVSVTTTPEGPAWPLRWNSPCAVAEVPPSMEVGEIDKL